MKKIPKFIRVPIYSMDKGLYLYLCDIAKEEGRTAGDILRDMAYGSYVAWGDSLSMKQIEEWEKKLEG